MKFKEREDAIRYLKSVNLYKRSSDTLRDKVIVTIANTHYYKHNNCDEYVKDRLQLTYRINNDLIAEEKVLYTIPFSEGGFDSQNNVVVQDFDADNKKTAKTATLGVVSKVSGQTYLKHISELPKNVTINTNRSQSTKNGH